MTKSMDYHFKIQGMDCAEEISTLKRELSSKVGGEEHLVFDILNKKLTVRNPNNAVNFVEIIAAIEKTGMRASPWEFPNSKTSFYEANGKFVLTLVSMISMAIGFIFHSVHHGGIMHAFQGGEGLDRHQFPALSIAFYVVSILSGSWFILPKAFYSLKKMRPDMNLLMTVAVIGAAFIGEWLESATVTILFSFSLLLESWSVKRARKATKALLDLAPNEVHIVNEKGVEELVQVTLVNVGTLFIVKPGERVPLDGTVMKGTSDMNQAPITGESLPVEKKENDSVFAGAINGNGALEIRCDKTSEHSTLSNIIRLVGEAHAQRAPSEQWVETFAKIYTPVVMGLALLVFIIPPMFLSGIWAEWLYRSLVLLVIACPCALVISTPVSIVAALTAAARNGVLIKGGKFVELPAHLKAMAFDKTGTITKGALSVSKIVCLSDHTEKELLEIVVAIEMRSEHPIAKAIVLHAKAKNISTVAAENYLTIQGKGATASIKSELYWIGSHRYLEEKGQETSDIHEQLEALTRSGHTVVVVGNSHHVCGFIALSDTIRPLAKETISQLHALGIKPTVMLTGDNQGTAALISSKVGLSQFYAELLPEDKVKRVEALVNEYKSVAMIGDGVNDAPAMARSTLGIAMGAAGSDAAIESADIALMTDDLSKIPWLISHSKRTISVIRQNIFFSLFIKFVFVMLTLIGYASLWTAIAADMGASLLVIFNGLRLLGSKNRL